MAETYSTTSPDLKEEGWGTTNIVLITNEGSGAIIVGVDSSVDNVIGRACGDVVNNGVHCAPKIVVKDGILRAPEMARSYIADWFEKCGRLIGRSTQYDFEGCLIMAGWDAKDAPYVCDVQRYGLTYVTRSKECVGFVNGSGRERVMEYFRACRLENKVQSSIELSQNVIRGLLCAALFDENSGGNLCVFEV
ncbi:PREDICTED: uncharacterized protein [Prunus dulcis]|nr:PREDICTED: uncharacterized protein [Prunus dulcis]